MLVEERALEAFRLGHRRRNPGENRLRWRYRLVHIKKKKKLFPGECQRRFFFCSIQTVQYCTRLLRAIATIPPRRAYCFTFFCLIFCQSRIFLENVAHLKPTFFREKK